MENAINACSPISPVTLRNFSFNDRGRFIGGEMEKEQISQKSSTRERIIQEFPNMDDNERIFYSSILAMGNEDSSLLLTANRLSATIIHRIHARKQLR